MRKAMLLAAVFGLIGSLWAADPSVGTWKLNIAKSKFAPGEKVTPKEGTIAVRELAGGEFELTFSETMTDGSKIQEKGTWPRIGGVLKSQPASADGTAIVTMIGPGEWYCTSLQNGKQTEVLHSAISKDGKTMQIKMKGTDAQGKSTESVSTWDKQ